MRPCPNQNPSCLQNQNYGNIFNFQLRPDSYRDPSSLPPVRQGSSVIGHPTLVIPTSPTGGDHPTPVFRLLSSVIQHRS
jgi:hypothetical protein